MMSETVADIINDARLLADAETPDGTVDFNTDPELLRYLNRAYKQLVGDIVRFGGQDLILRWEILTPATIPAYAVEGVYRDVALEARNGDRWTDLHRFTFRERNRHQDSQYPSWRWLHDAVAGGGIKFYPEDAEPAELRFWFIPDPTTFELADTVGVFGGWDAYLSARIAMMMLAKEERSTSDAAQEFKIAREHVRTSCLDLNPARADRVANVHRVPEDYEDAGLYQLAEWPLPDPQ